MFEEIIAIGLSIIVLPPILEKLSIDLRAGEVVTGIVMVMFFPDLAHNNWISGIAEIGLLILMFEIGLDIDVERLKKTLNESLFYGTLSFVLPFMILLPLSYFLLDNLMAAIIIGTSLSTTSLAVVSPIIRREGIESEILKNASMVAEMLGISILIGFVRSRSISANQIVTEAFAIFGFICFTIFVVPKIVSKLKIMDSKKIINFETKVVAFIVLATAMISEKLGIHGATGAFLAGLFFSESTHRGIELEKRIKPIFELLVPVFFFHIGTFVDPKMLTGSLVGASFLTAVGVFTVRNLGFHIIQSYRGKKTNFSKVSLFAPCITITATATSIGRSMGVLSANVFTFVLLAGLFLTVLGPFVTRYLRNRT